MIEAPVRVELTASRTVVKRGIYLVPSLLTLSNLAAGVVSILLSASGHLTSAAWAIVAGIIMDMLDGRVARWTGTTSNFGLELDSLADLVTFGVAPAIMMYQLALAPLGRPGYMIAVFFPIASALRLARFNLKAQTGEKTSYFTGLPAPAAAGILASFVLSYELFDSGVITVKTIPLVMQKMPIFFRSIPVVMLLLAFLMISTIQYGNFKQLKLGRPKSLQSLTIMIAGLLLIFTYPQNTIFILFSLYVISGLLAWAWRFSQTRAVPRPMQNFRRRRTDRQEPTEGGHGGL